MRHAVERFKVLFFSFIIEMDIRVDRWREGGWLRYTRKEAGRRAVGSGGGQGCRKSGTLDGNLTLPVAVEPSPAGNESRKAASGWRSWWVQTNGGMWMEEQLVGRSTPARPTQPDIHLLLDLQAADQMVVYKMIIICSGCERALCAVPSVWRVADPRPARR